MIYFRKKKWKLVLMMPFLTLALMSCQLQEQRVNQPEGAYGIKSNYLASGKEPGGDDYYIINRNNDRNGMFFMIIETIPSMYAINIRLSMTDNELGVSEDGERLINQTKTDEFLLDVYDLETNTLKKTIDAKAILNRNKTKIQVTGLSYFETRSIKGMPYLGFRIEDYPETLEDGQVNTRRMLWINLETEEYVEDKNMVEYIEDRGLAIFDSSKFLENNLPAGKWDFLDSFSVFENSYWTDCYYAELRLELLPDDNEKLYTKFPSLKEQVEKIRELEGEYWIRVYFTDSPTAEEIMELFTPGGRSVSFEGLKYH